MNELIKTDLKNYSDIAIIARKNSELKEIAEILEEENSVQTKFWKKYQ